MDGSLSGGISRYLDVLYEEYDGFDVQQTTVSVTPEELAALDEKPDGMSIRARIEGDSGVLAFPEGNEWELPGATADIEPVANTVEALLEERTGVRCSIDGLDRISIACLQCEAVADEVWTLSALFTATAAGGSPRDGAVWREQPVHSSPPLSSP